MESSQEIQNLTHEIVKLRNAISTLVHNFSTDDIPTGFNTTNSERLNPKRLAEHLNVSIKTVYARSNRKSRNPWPFKVYRVGRKLHFIKAEVDKALLEEVI